MIKQYFPLPRLVFMVILWWVLWGNSIDIKIFWAIKLPSISWLSVCPFQICYHSIQTPFITNLDISMGLLHNFRRHHAHNILLMCSLDGIQYIAKYNSIQGVCVCVCVCVLGWGCMPTRAMQQRFCPTSAARPQPILHTEARVVFSSANLICHPSPLQYEMHKCFSLF